MAINHGTKEVVAVGSLSNGYEMRREVVAVRSPSNGYDLARVGGLVRITPRGGCGREF